MSERHVVLGVSGSIAAYKAVDLASKLTVTNSADHSSRITTPTTSLIGSWNNNAPVELYPAMCCKLLDPQTEPVAYTLPA